ncbi:MAG: ABC transporter permease [Jiangellales bacterium]
MSPSTRTDTSAETRLPSVARVGLARTRLELTAFFREKDALIWTLLYPIVLLAIFGSVFDQEIAPGVSFSQYFLAGMIATGLMLVSFQQLAIGIALERDDGTLKRLEGTPMPRAAYFIGKIGMVLVTAVAQITLLLVVAVLFFDIELPTDSSSWATFAWVSVLGITSGTLLGVAFSSIPRSGKSAAAVVTPPLLILQFISGVFFVFTQLPTWMQTVASLFPLKWMAQGMRSVFLPDYFAAEEAAGSWQLGLVALVLVAWTIGGLVLALTTFRWRRRDDG